MQTHKLNKKAIAVTGLPENSRYKIFNDEKPYLSFFNGHETFRLYLPLGKWKALGFAQDLKEEDWKRVLQTTKFENGITVFDDPDNSEMCFLTDTEAANSLLKSKGLFVSNPYAKPAEEEYMPGENFTKKQQAAYWLAHREWQSAQLLSNPLILIIE